jgi:hypothetical protein
LKYGRGVEIGRRGGPSQELTVEKNWDEGGNVARINSGSISDERKFWARGRNIRRINLTRNLDERGDMARIDRSKNLDRRGKNFGRIYSRGNVDGSLNWTEGQSDSSDWIRYGY